MENASKALIMAGSILMAMLIIGLLVFAFNNFSNMEQTESDMEAIRKLSDYSQRFEQYNKTIYGSELMSIANLQEDYQKTQVELNGYEPIVIRVTIKNSIAGTTYFSAGTKDISSITADKNEVEDEIRKYEETRAASSAGKLYKNRVVKYYAQITNRQIAEIYGIDYSSSETDYDIGDRLEAYGGEVTRLKNDISAYQNIKTVYTEFKNKRFKCKNIGYGQTGRVNLMEFEEV